MTRAGHEPGDAPDERSPVDTVAPDADAPVGPGSGSAGPGTDVTIDDGGDRGEHEVERDDAGGGNGAREHDPAADADADPGAAADPSDVADPGDEADESDGRSGGRGLLLAGLAVAAALALPILIAAFAVRTPRWYPQVDLAQIELRVRDVFSSHPPTIGLGGRIYGINNTQGAHPGPLSFYLLAPIHRLAGDSAWGLQLAGAIWNAIVIAATLWATSRRWGLRGLLLVGAGLSFLIGLYGTELLVYPWNPFMPVLFWMLFLVCAWGVLCGDLPLLPVAVFAGTLCAQTHIPYVGLVGGLVLVMAVSLVRRYRRAGDDATTRRRVRRWAGGSALLGAFLWAPVVIQQFGGNPGNVSIIWDGVIHKRDPAVGWGEGWSILLRHLDVTRLLGADGEGSAWVGVVLLLAWAATAFVAFRRRERDLTALHVVVAAAVGFGLFNAANIMGTPWYYLTLWAYGTGVLAAVAIVATLARVVGERLAARPDADRWRRLAWVPTAGLVVAIAVPLVPVLRDAPDTEVHDQEAVSADFAHVFGPTVAAIEDGTIPGGPDGTYLVTWNDPISLGGPGFAMIDELERLGYDVGAPVDLRLSVRDHRVVEREDADAEIHVAYGVGPVDQARVVPGAREIATFDRRTPAERETYAELREEIVRDLTDAGMEEALPDLDQNLIALATHPDLPSSVTLPLFTLGRMPQPMSVFVWEPGAWDGGS